MTLIERLLAQANKEANELSDLLNEAAQSLAQPQKEPFGHVTVRRLSQRFENHSDSYQFYPACDQPYLDNVDECHVVYTSPPAQPQQEPVAKYIGECAEGSLVQLYDDVKKGTELYTAPPAQLNKD